MRTIYTVGHGLLTQEALITSLLHHEIELVVDVRSQPMSTRAPHFNRDALREALEVAGIAYAWKGRALGGRPAEHLRTTSGAPDYERMAVESITADAIDQLAEAAVSRRIALLCSESKPEECHRSRMLEPQFELRGAAVEHILPDGNLAARPTLFL